MIKKIITLAFVLLLIMNVGVAFAGNYAEDVQDYRVNDTNEQVEVLVNMGLIKGNEEGDLLLEDELIRIEGAVVYTRLFGIESEAFDFEDEDETFSDVPGWGARYVNFLKSKGLVNGISEESFGSWELMTAEQFTTMVLRGMGYDDSAGDFIWSESLEKAKEIGMITEDVKSDIEQEDSFTREEMMVLSYNALFTPTKTGKLLLQERQQLYDISVTAFISLDLTQEELDEILSIEYGSSKQPFDNDSKAQEELYTKFTAYIQKLYDLASVSIDGEKIEFEVGNIQNITDGRDQGIYVQLGRSDDLKLRNDGTLVYMGQDASFLRHMTIRASTHIKNKMYGGISGARTELTNNSDDTSREIKVSKDGKIIYEADVLLDHQNLDVQIFLK